MPDVFISHRTQDGQIARRIAQVFDEERITYYIDDYDAGAGQAEDITAYLSQKIQDCFCLMAVVTAHTRDSWWVPFEIGVATECPRAISSMTDLSSEDLPEYLTKWPVLRGESDLRRFARVFKKQSLRDKHLTEDRASLALTVAGFHLTLQVPSLIMEALRKQA